MGLHAVEAVEGAACDRVQGAAGPPPGLPAPTPTPGAGAGAAAAPAGGSSDVSADAGAGGDLADSSKPPQKLEGYAVTMHLYIPPFRRCRAWTKPEDSSHVLAPVMTYYSEFGEVVEY